MTIRTLFNDCVENKAKIINAKLSEIKFYCYLPNLLGIKRNYCLNMFDYLIKGFCICTSECNAYPMMNIWFHALSFNCDDLKL